jgi:hypothetical protein
MRENFLETAPMRRKTNRRLLYPLRKLEVGDSFDVPIEKLNSASVTAYKFGKAHGMKFSVHYVYNQAGTNIKYRKDGMPRVEIERIE